MAADPAFCLSRSNTGATSAAGGSRHHVNCLTNPTTLINRTVLCRCWCGSSGSTCDKGSLDMGLCSLKRLVWLTALVGICGGGTSVIALRLPSASPALMSAACQKVESEGSFGCVLKSKDEFRFSSKHYAQHGMSNTNDSQ